MPTIDLTDEELTTVISALARSRIATAIPAARLEPFRLALAKLAPKTAEVSVQVAPNLPPAGRAHPRHPPALTMPHNVRDGRSRSGLWMVTQCRHYQ